MKSSNCPIALDRAFRENCPGQWSITSIILTAQYNASLRDKRMPLAIISAEGNRLHKSNPNFAHAVAHPS